MIDNPSKVLYVKFRSSSGRFYLFDTRTNLILEVSSTVYSIIDDYSLVDKDELMSKYSDKIDIDELHEAIAALNEMQSKRVLAPSLHHPFPVIAGITLDQKKVYTIDEFLSAYSRMITLELTQRCNLNCEYCCYGKHYNRYRSHGNGVMPIEVGEYAIRYHINAKNSGNSIGFYGGEPLLEFDHLKHFVLYAEKYALKQGKELPSFHMTTNGTLLTDDVIHFLVKHKFSVLVSIDGDNKVHNKYRVFKDTHQGSYDVIMKNLERFVQLYPDYQHRGFALTLTADNDFERSNDFIKNNIKHFPVLNISRVNPIVSCEDCDKNSCLRMIDEVDGTHLSSALPPFVNWTSDRLNAYYSCMNRFYRDFEKSPENARKEWPIFYKLFLRDFRKIHMRKIKTRYSIKIACGCIPGSVRLYCDIHGNLYPCEKVESSPSLKIGDVWSGPIPNRVRDIMNYMSKNTSCSLCNLQHVCSLCPVHITEESSGQISASILNMECKKSQETIHNRLTNYVSLIEKMPSLFDEFKRSDGASHNDDWIEDFYIVLDKENFFEIRQQIQRCHCPKQTGNHI